MSDGTQIIRASGNRKSSPGVVDKAKGAGAAMAVGCREVGGFRKDLWIQPTGLAGGPDMGEGPGGEMGMKVGPRCLLEWLSER